MLKLYDSRIMSFVLAEAKKKGGKLDLQGTGGIKSYSVQQDSLHFSLKRTGLLNNSKVISYIFVGLFGRSIASYIGHICR